MTTETQEAWVLHKRPSGDTSALVTFFTPNKGILTCLVKAGRTPKKQGLLQAFQPLWLALEIRRDWHYVRHIEPATAAIPLAGPALFSGLYLNELLYYALRPMDAQPELFDAYLIALHQLALTTERLNLEALLRRFEWQLILACGCPVSFIQEADTGAPLQANTSYRLIATEGFIADKQGPISGQDLLALAKGQLDDPKLLKTAKRIMRQIIDNLLDGRQLKSRSLFSTKTGM